MTSDGNNHDLMIVQKRCECDNAVLGSTKKCYLLSLGGRVQQHKKENKHETEGRAVTHRSLGGEEEDEEERDRAERRIASSSS